jgi:predicted nucleotidyltransferase
MAETSTPPAVLRGPAGSHLRDDHYGGATPARETVTEVVAAVVAALHAAEVPFVVVGGLVTAAVSRPRTTDDIDVFVQPHHAGAALDGLEAAGFDVERTDPMWLYKAWLDGVLVDVIFRSTGDIYLDDEMLARATWQDCRGTRARMISAEDLLVIKAVTTTENGSHHWYDALGIIGRTPLDWAYVVRRARQAGPRRVLSLLLYAESNDLAVPSDVVEELFGIVHPPAPVAP